MIGRGTRRRGIQSVFGLGCVGGRNIGGSHLRLGRVLSRAHLGLRGVRVMSTCGSSLVCSEEGKGKVQRYVAMCRPMKPEMVGRCEPDCAYSEAGRVSIKEGSACPKGVSASLQEAFFFFVT